MSKWEKAEQLQGKILEHTEILRVVHDDGQEQVTKVVLKSNGMQT